MNYFPDQPNFSFPQENLCYVTIQCYGLIAAGYFGKLAQFTRTSPQNVDKTKRTPRDKKKIENNLLLESIVKNRISLHWTE